MGVGGWRWSYLILGIPARELFCDTAVKRTPISDFRGHANSFLSDPFPPDFHNADACPLH